MSTKTLRMSFATLCTSLALLSVPSGCLSQVPHVDVETSVTYASPFQPEIHFLLQSREDKPLPFILNVGMSEDDYPSAREATEALRCTRNMLIGSRYDNGPWDYLNYETVTGRITGRLPPGKWVHRIVALGPTHVLQGCRIPYWIEFGKGKERTMYGAVNIPGDRGRGDSDAANPNQMTFQAMVEQDWIANRVQIHLIARNSGELNAWDLRVVDRSIECTSGTKAHWSWRNHFLPPAELSVGPQLIPAAGLGGFILPVEFDDISKASKCVATIQLTGMARAGQEPFQFPAIRTNLQPTADPRDVVLKNGR